MDATPGSLLLALIVIFLTVRLTFFLSALKKVSFLPGFRCAFGPVTPLGSFLPTCWWNPGLNWAWRWRNTVYPKYDTDTISIVSFLLGKPTICTRSIQVARQIITPKGTDFVKGEEISAPVIEYGPNLFSVEGDEWKRHRRILNPAFSPATYALVWQASSEVYDEIMTAEGWSNHKEVDISAQHFSQLTLKFALIIISRCGFGTHLSWDFMKTNPQDGMGFAEALDIVCRNHIIRLLIPRWAYQLPSRRIRSIHDAFITLGRFLSNLIKTKREALSTGSQAEKINASDVFTLMLKASENEGKLGMDDDELAGNTFLMLFAGHDTTAHTLRATFGLLALYQEVQEETYQQIMEVAPKLSDMTFEIYSRLSKVRAAFLEAGRLYPPAQMMIRDVIRDSILTGVGPDGKQQIPVVKGMRLVVDIAGINYNPRYYPDPETFKLERWYDATENDMTMFSFGPRSCIGRRFALTEATSFLSRVLRDWRVDITLNEGETREQWRARVMTTTAFMTLRVDEFPIRFIRRQ